MARKGGVDRGVTQRKDRKGWWVRIYANGRQQWFRCDSKSQAEALYGRLKAEHREGKYFEKARIIRFEEIADDYIQALDARRRRKGDDKAGSIDGFRPSAIKMLLQSLLAKLSRS